MQLFALDENRSVSAQVAIKKKNYLCPECRALVRARGGPSRQLHFFHLKATSSCKQHQKGRIHLQLQLAIQSLLPEGHMEYSFPTICRIADVVCLQSKRVFEIQVSPISSEEVMARCRDYESLGFQIVWILHEKRFNRRLLTSAEWSLREKCRYFSNMTADGRGIVYDQLEQLNGFRRIERGPPLPVNLKIFYSSPFHHEGDLKSRMLKGQIQPPQIEKKKAPNLYQRLFRLLLKKVV
jgi:competence protein CoiA